MSELADALIFSNEQLALRAQQGCAASFAELVGRFQVPLVHFLQQRSNSLEDAEDLTQEAFVRAYRGLPSYCPQWRFSTWLFTIAHRLSLNARRRRRPTADSQLLLNVAAAGAAPEQAVAAADEAGQLWGLAARVLTANQLTALWLFYVEELSLEEIAQVVGSRPTAAKGLLFRARRKLAAALAGPAELLPTAASRSEIFKPLVAR